MSSLLDYSSFPLAIVEKSFYIFSQLSFNLICGKEETTVRLAYFALSWTMLGAFSVDAACWDSLYMLMAADLNTLLLYPAILWVLSNQPLNLDCLHLKVKLNHLQMRSFLREHV